MPESRIKEVIYELFKDVGKNVLEERMADYIVNELRGGRHLSDILKDPYLTDRIDRDHLTHVLENKKVFEAFEKRIKESLK